MSNFENKKGDEQWEYDQTKAAESIINKIPLVVDKDEVLYKFNGKIYEKNVEWYIADKICKICMNAVGKSDVNETLWRITNSLMYHPVEFNKDPFAFPAKDGLIDLKTGKFRPYTTQDFFTYQYNALYDCPEAFYDRFLWFLCTSLEDPRDVLTAIDIITAVAIKKSFDSVVLLIGRGGNGKGIFEKVIKALYTEGRITAEELKEVVRSNFGAGALFDTDAWIIAEVRDVNMAMNFLKKVATGEMIDSDVKYKGRKKGVPHALPILDTNEAFAIDDKSNGRIRRFIKLDWPYVFDGLKPDRPIDKTLESYLTHEWALSGLLKIVIARAPSLIRTMRIYERKSKAQTSEEYERQSNSFEKFCDDCLSTEWTKKGKDGKLAKCTRFDKDITAIYNEYKEYCGDFHVLEPISDNQFGRCIGDKFNAKSKSTSTKENGVKVTYRYYPGVFLVKSALEAFAEINQAKSDTTNTTDLLNEWLGGNSNRGLNTTDTTDSLLESIIEEIIKMYEYIKGCKDNKEITYELYKAKSTVSVVQAQEIAISPTEKQETSVVQENCEVLDKDKKVAA